MNKLSKSLLKEIMAYPLKIKIKYATPNHLPVSQEDIHLKRYRANAELMIWGRANCFKDDGEKICDLRGLSFSSSAIRLPANPGQMRIAFPNLPSVLSGKDWSIKDKFSYSDIPRIENNLREISLYVLGSLAYLKRNFQDAITIFKVLLQMLQDNNVFQLKLKSAINQDLANSYYGLATTHMKRLKPPLNKIEEKQLISLAIVHVEQSIRLNSKNWNFYLTLGYLKFLDENFLSSGKAIGIAKKLAPKNSALPYFSSGFLKLFHEKNIKGAIHDLTIACKKNYDPSKMCEIAEFYDRNLKKYPEKIFLHLGLGIINKECIEDPLIARQDFESFLGKSKALSVQQDISLAIDFAKKNLEDL